MKDIEFIIRNNYDAVVSLYREYGINKQPNVQNTLDAYVVYGEPFLMRLFEIASDEQEHFLGKIGEKIKGGIAKRKDKKAAEKPLTEEEEQAKKAAKGKKWENFKNGFNQVTGLVAGSGLPGILGGLIGEGGSGGGNGGSTDPKPPAPDEKKIMGMSQPLFIGLCVVVLLVGILAFSQSGKSK